MLTVEEWPFRALSESSWISMSDAFEQYELRYGVQLVDKLGHGKDGSVFETAKRAAVKFFDQQSLYQRELRAYQILRQRNIDEVNGFQVPKLIRFDGELLAIEMTIVQPRSSLISPRPTRSTSTTASTSPPRLS